MKDTFQISNSKKGGSVLILALVLASILLSVGMGISGIAMKEIKLSSIGNESGKAFYAADSAAECALFWDIQRPYGKKTGVFATSSDSLIHNLIPPLRPTIEVRCPYSNFDIASEGDPTLRNGPGPTPINPPTPAWSVETSFSGNYAYATTTFLAPYDYWDPSAPCAFVTVAKKTDTTTGVEATVIDSRGRSSCDTNPRRVERGLKVSY